MIFITGAHATGKNYTANIICRNNFEEIDLGPTIRSAYKNSDTEKTFAEWIRDGELKHGKNFADELLVKEIKNAIYKSTKNGKSPVDFLIIGSRSVSGLRYILGHIGKYKNKDNKIIYLEAPFKVMYERYKKREGIDIAESEFQKLLDKDRAMGIEELRTIADYIIVNNLTREQLTKEIGNLLRDKLKYTELEKTLGNENKMTRIFKIGTVFNKIDGK